MARFGAGGVGEGGEVWEWRWEAEGRIAGSWCWCWRWRRSVEYCWCWDLRFGVGIFRGSGDECGGATTIERYRCVDGRSEDGRYKMILGTLGAGLGVCVFMCL